ncbi:MAG: Mur ligase family protein, partial [Ruminococcus sp.]
SQFEITFAIALLWFLEQHCDLVVLETGIGGLLDATNVVKKPLVCAITSVSFDHMALLGNTLTEIAAQKAGIIKQGCPVVLSTDNPMDVVCLVQETAKQKNAQLVIPNMQDCRILSETLEETVFQYHSFTYTLHMPASPVYNAMTAIEVIRFLGMHGYLITAAVANDAFSKVRVPARTELLRKDPMVRWTAVTTRQALWRWQICCALLDRNHSRHLRHDLHQGLSHCLSDTGWCAGYGHLCG